MAVQFDDMTYTYLIEILNEKFYSTTDMKEIMKIQSIYKALGYDSGSFVSTLQTEKFL